VALYQLGDLLSSFLLLSKLRSRCCQHRDRGRRPRLDERNAALREVARYSRCCSPCCSLRSVPYYLRVPRCSLRSLSLFDGIRPVVDLDAVQVEVRRAAELGRARVEGPGRLLLVVEVAEVLILPGDFDLCLPLALCSR
jgi:hypothetical protein